MSLINTSLIPTNPPHSYIAILIGRLGLIAPQAREEYTALLAEVLAGPMGEAELDRWLKEFVKKHTGSPDTPMLDPNSPTNHCKTYVWHSSIPYSSN